MFGIHKKSKSFLIKLASPGKRIPPAKFLIPTPFPPTTYHYLENFVRRCHTIKAGAWNLFKFSWVSNYIEKYVKINFKKNGVTILFSRICKSEDQKYYKNQTKDTVFVNILGFIFYGISHTRTNLHNKYMIKLCVWHSFRIRSSIKLNYCRSYTKRRPKCIHISK